MSDADHFKRVSELLGLSLQTAVPLLIMDAKTRAPSIRDTMLDFWAEDAAHKVAHNGDMLMFKSKARRAHEKDCKEALKPRPECDCLIGTAQVFNALAKGVAAGSFAPGGICTFGLQFCASHLIGGKSVGKEHGQCLYCVQEEEIMTLGHQSLLDRFWRELDRYVDELQGFHNGDVGAIQLDKVRGRADNAALFIALLADPYNPDTDKVRKEAMRRWRRRQKQRQQGKVLRGQIETAKPKDDVL